MISLPAKCNHCGHLFVPRAIVGLNVTALSVSGSLVACPRCGQPAHLVEGNFDLTAGELRVNSAPPRTIEILDALHLAYRQVESGADEGEVIATLAKASPEISAAASKASARYGRSGLVCLLLLLLAQCAANTHATLDWNKLIDQAHVYMTGAEPYSQQAEPSAVSRSKTEQRSGQDDERQPSRQQRRQTERQERKKAPTISTTPSPTRRP